MAQGHADEYGQKQSGRTAYAPTPEHAPSHRSKPCGCSGATPCTCSETTTSTCCDTECFERPRYFCGHLLTDTDLSLEQHYVVGKHKLYHRALHGTGIVCGLRLTCHPECDGYVMVGEGFAIDDCGNDLVVCEPMPFDVIGALRRKKLLYTPPPRRDDCKPGQPESECIIPQCYYVVACYEEAPGEYATPLTPSCGPSPRDCEPTRIRETVRFDVVDKLPKAADPLGDLECRIKLCFALLTDGPFAEVLQEPIVREALAGSANVERHDEWCNLICRLRILFKRYLECHADRYNCTLEKDVDAICCPPDPRKPYGYPPNYPYPAQGQPGQTQPAGQQAGAYPTGTMPGQGQATQGYTPQAYPPAPAPQDQTGQAQTGQGYSSPSSYSSQNYGTEIRNAVCRIVELAYSHVMACVMGELAFTCQEPAKASCIVLGTVEVENGCLMRVCNCPRTYVWSFGSFWQVLMATLFGSQACKSNESETMQSPGDTTTPHGPVSTQEPYGLDKLADRYRRCSCGSPLGDKPCCQEFKPRDGCEEFIRTLAEGGRATSDLATGLLEAIEWIRCSVQHTFDPTRTDAVLLRAFRGRQYAEVSQAFQGKARITPKPAPTKCVPWGLIDALDMVGHATFDNRFVALTENGVVVDVVKQGVQDRLTTTETNVESVQQELAAVKGELEKVKKMLSQYGPPTGGGQGGVPGAGPRGRKRGAPGGSTTGGRQP